MEIHDEAVGVPVRTNPLVIEQFASWKPWFVCRWFITIYHDVPIKYREVIFK